MDQRQAKLDCQWRKTHGRALVGTAQDDDQEHVGHDQFSHEVRHHRVAAGRMLAIVVRDEAGLAAGDEVEQAGADEAADDLGDDVGKEFLALEPSAEPQAYRDRRVEMAAGDDVV